MEAKIKNPTIIILHLNTDEAVWLKQLVQNPFCDPEEEKDKKFREGFWVALNEVVHT